MLHLAVKIISVNTVNSLKMVEESQELEPTLTVPSPISPINQNHTIRMPWGRLTPYDSSPLRAFGKLTNI